MISDKEGKELKKKFLIMGLCALVMLTACGNEEAKTDTSVSVSESKIVESTEETEPDVSGEPEEALPEPEPEPEETLVGDFIISGDRTVVTGGVYEQDGNPDNGLETITWRVLSEENGHMLLISECVLDMVPFNSSYEGVTWDDSYVRTYLNDTFYNGAFSETQKSIICDYVTTAADVSANVAEVTDKVFLLSYDEAKKYFKNTDKACEERAAKVTEYAKSNGVYYIDEEDFKLFGYEEDGISEKTIGAGNWWLRTNGGKLTEAMDVGATGIIRTVGHDVGSVKDGIRPAIWISIDG